jgi:hypothetical protein
MDQDRMSLDPSAKLEVSRFARSFLGVSFIFVRMNAHHSEKKKPSPAGNILSRKIGGEYREDYRGDIR